MIQSDIFQKHVADELMRLRYEKNMTAKEVGEKAGVHHMTVFKYELNKVPYMRLATLVAILKALDMPVSIFFERVSALAHKEDKE